MKVYFFTLQGKEYVSKILPIEADLIATYDSDNMLDQSAIYSNAIENNELAILVMRIWREDYSQD